MTDNLENAIFNFTAFMLPFIIVALGLALYLLFKEPEEKEIEASKDENPSSDESSELEEPEFRNSTCYFCGSPFANDWEAHNAEDFGLHPETQGKACCPRCNKLVTSTNRNISLFLKGMPMNEEDFGGNLFYLEEAAVNLLDFVKEERNARDEI